MKLLSNFKIKYTYNPNYKFFVYVSNSYFNVSTNYYIISDTKVAPSNSNFV